MAESQRQIVIASAPLQRDVVRSLADAWFGDMIKVVVDVRRRLLAAGGELHADAEQLLIEDGSLQDDLWGANYYPGRPRDDSIEFTALIKIRPSAGNRSMEIEDADLRTAVSEIVFRILGESEGEGPCSTRR